MQLSEQLFENILRLKSLLVRGPGTLEDRMATRLQFASLCCIRRDEGLNVKDLAAQLNLSMSSATQLIDRLVSAKLILREADLKDRRKLKLSLTQSGLDELMKQKELYLKQMTQWLDILDEQEKHQLLSLTNKLLNHFQK